MPQPHRIAPNVAAAILSGPPAFSSLPAGRPPNPAPPACPLAQCPPPAPPPWLWPPDRSPRSASPAAPPPAARANASAVRRAPPPLLALGCRPRLPSRPACQATRAPRLVVRWPLRGPTSSRPCRRFLSRAALLLSG